MISTTNLCESLSIQTWFENSNDKVEENNNDYYSYIILGILKKILPPDFFESKENLEMTYNHQRKILKQVIPLITCCEARNFPGNVSFFALSRYCQNSFKFFFEMVSRWLIPGKRLNVILVYATDFKVPDLSDEVYTVCEVMISLKDQAEFLEIQRHFPTIEAEISLGIHSTFFAQRILEIKGLSADEKTAFIQATIAFLVKRFPQIYNADVFTEMQHVLVMCRDDFKAARQARHLSRIIGVQYLFRRSLRESIRKNPHRRYVTSKIFRSVIQASPGRKRVLAVLVGLNLLRDQETFGEKHLLKAIHHYIPAAQAVENSFFINKLPSESICTVYLEIEKKDGSDFTSLEIRKLRHELSADLKNRVEHKLHPIFMPRNEEEIMRNLLILANQIKYVRDIPQIFISFDEQSHSHLFFTVILVRIFKPESVTIAESFKKTPTFLEYVHDRTKIVGYIRKKYAKEATVFHLKLPKDSFLRADHSIDLYKARQTVVTELSRVIGEVRDYNGGMISKQHELLTDIRRSLVEVKEYNELLLENFFYSLAPVVVRALLDPKAFKTLFLMLLEGIKEYKQEGYYLKFYKEPYSVFALIIIEDPQIKDVLNKVVHDLHIPPTELATAHVKTSGNICIGYICCAHDPNKKEQLLKVVQDTLQAWGLFHQR